MKNTFLISTHAVYTNRGKALHGTGSALEPYLKNKGCAYIIVKYPLVGNFSTSVTNRIAESNHDEENLMNSTSKWFYKPLFRPFVEFTGLLLLIKNKKSKDVIFIGIDPLNALYGIVLKWLSLVKKVIYYTADYSHNRYSNKILNSIYHSIDRFACKFSDDVWAVSSRIRDLRQKQGVPDVKNNLVPNSPKFEEFEVRDNNYELVIVSSSPTSTDIPVVLEAIGEMKTVFPRLSLSIIGMDNWKNEFDSQIERFGISDRVVFHSSMPHGDLLEKLRSASIGIALYTNQSSWTHFSDSMKVRDYLACGLPVIMTDVMATAQDIEQYKAGKVIRIDKREFAGAIRAIFASEQMYREYKYNTLKLAKDFDIFKILDERLANYL